LDKSKDIETTPAFYFQLLDTSKYVLLLVTLVCIIQLYLLPQFEKSLASTILLLLAIGKAIAIVVLSFNQLAKIIGQSHLLTHVLTLFAFLIGLIILSFTFDFLGLQVLNPGSFKMTNLGSASRFKIGFEIFYFSTVTFSSVGYGDVVPVSFWAKMLVILEIILRFFVLVFGIANINQIRINGD